MHHYGENAVKVEITHSEFIITLTNHHSGAEIQLRGPREGVFESNNRVLTIQEAKRLGDEVAHLLRQFLAG
jgi:hypothetical protein